MKTINAYETRDGLIFQSSDEAERHEKFLDNRAKIEEFIESNINQYKSSAQRSIVRNTVINWILWSAKTVQ